MKAGKRRKRPSSLAQSNKEGGKRITCTFPSHLIKLRIFFRFTVISFTHGWYVKHARTLKSKKMKLGHNIILWRWCKKILYPQVDQCALKTTLNQFVQGRSHNGMRYWRHNSVQADGNILMPICSETIVSVALFHQWRFVFSRYARLYLQNKPYSPPSRSMKLRPWNLAKKSTKTSLEWE